jgi:PAS domain S-box-containing protein
MMDRFGMTKTSTLPGDSSLHTENELLSAIVATQQEVATAGLDTDRVMRVISERTQCLTGATGAVIELAEGDEMVYRAVTGTAASSLGLRLKIATSLSGLSASTGEVLRCDDAETDHRVDKEACRRVGVRSMIVVPLPYTGKEIGVLKVLSDQVSAFTEQHVQTLQLMTGLLAAALNNARAFEVERINTTESARALSATEERFSLLVRSVKDYAILMLDPQGRIISWNEGAERIKGYTTNEIIGSHVSCFYTKDAIECGWPDELLRRAADGQCEDEGWRVRKDGSTFWADVHITALRDQSGILRGFAKVTRDMTERRKLEEQLRQSQKMEAFGQLAGGVAHDFNNLLTIISGYSDMLLEQLPSDDPCRELVQEVHKAGERAASLTRQLLAFSRKQILEPKVLNLNQIVSDTERMLRRLIGEDINLATTLATTLRTVKVDPGQMEQVILNLVVNARDAMLKGGHLTIETANIDLDNEKLASNPDAKPGRYVLLAVRDTGCGMTPEIQARIFEPFFTTKGLGKGTGLGLATVFGIVKQSGGLITVDTEPGRGTTFQVYLPSVEQALTGESVHSSKTTLKGHETLLVAEDESAVLGIIRLALRSQGYTVLEASGGPQALRVAQAHSGPIHLLVTDVVMPELSGRELAERLCTLRPGLKVLYLSGHTDDAVVRQGVQEAHIPFLQKPFTPGQLAAKIREVLDQP